MRRTLVCAALALAATTALAHPQVSLHQWAAVSWQLDAGGTPQPLQASDTLPGFAHQAKGADTTSGTMRIDRAVGYFHMPQQVVGALKVNLAASITSGTITDYYPHGTAQPGGGVEWSGISLGEAAEGPETTDTAWLAPRAVGGAATLKVDLPTPADGRTTEGDVYLFYRGVGDVAPPVQVRTLGDELVLQLAAGSTTLPQEIKAAWYIDLNPAGNIAFTELGAITPAQPTKSNPARFPPEGYTQQGFDGLESVIREALNGEGLADDESAALLNLLRKDITATKGRSILLLLPQTWLHQNLPLNTAGIASSLIRLGIGRIGLK